MRARKLLPLLLRVVLLRAQDCRCLARLLAHIHIRRHAGRALALPPRATQKPPEQRRALASMQQQALVLVPLLLALLRNRVPGKAQQRLAQAWVQVQVQVQGHSPVLVLSLLLLLLLLLLPWSSLVVRWLLLLATRLARWRLRLCCRRDGSGSSGQPAALRQFVTSQMWMQMQAATTTMTAAVKLATAAEMRMAAPATATL